MSTAIIPITTNSSTRVNPRRLGRMSGFHRLEIYPPKVV